MNEWNKEQLKNVIEDMDKIQARFYMDSVGNEVADILNEAQRKLKDIYNTYEGIEEWPNENTNSSQERRKSIMAQYGISVKEILKRTVIVEAENLEEAVQKVEDAVKREEIILDVDDYDDREIIPSEYFEGGKVPDGKDVSFYWHIGEDN